MGSVTTTVWDCQRCEKEVILPDSNQPNNWHSVKMNYPPRSSSGVNLGDLCTECGGELLHWINGDDLLQDHSEEPLPDSPRDRLDSMHKEPEDTERAITSGFVTVVDTVDDWDREEPF